MMQELFAQPYFGVLLTIAAYWAGMKIQHKTRLAICNGMLLAVLLVIAVLLVFHIPYESYYQGGALINLFLGPATACMAVTIYSQRRLLAKHWLPVLVGCTVGVVTAMGSILLLCRLFGLDRAMAMSLLPKSVTMPIATVVSQGHGGTMAITVAAVVVTGMLGNLCAPLLVKLFRVKDPIAVGLGIGACSHAMGTAKALELGETEGAMSGLAIGLCGILTTVLALFAGFLGITIIQSGGAVRPPLFASLTCQKGFKCMEYLANIFDFFVPDVQKRLGAPENSCAPFCTKTGDMARGALV